MEEKRDNVEEKLENMGENPESKEEKTANRNEGLEGSGEKAKSAGENPEDAKENPAGVDKNPERTDENPERTEESPAGAEEKTANVEEGAGTQRTEEAAADKEEGKSKDAKRHGSRNKIAGFAELAVAFLLIVLSAWLFINTRGTRLLYVSVTTGRVSRYYWVFAATAAIVAALGLATLRRCRMEDGKKLPKKDKKARREK